MFRVRSLAWVLQRGRTCLSAEILKVTYTGLAGKGTLQRGRTCLSAEIKDPNEAEALLHHASTGPHLFECGDIIETIPALMRDDASTGPHLFECGDC